MSSIALLPAACATDDTAQMREPTSHRHRGGHHRFEDAESWAKRFDDPRRDEWQRPEVVLDLLDLESTHLLADIGAGTGYFAVRAARRLPEGKVYGVDVEPDMVRYLDERSAREGLTNVVGVLAAQDDPRLPEAVDRVLVVDTYHHLERRPAYFRALQARLLPGGTVAIVDFRLGELPVGPPEPMKVGPERVIAEMDEAGYDVVRDERTALPYQYVLVFAPRARL